ncbi:MAG: hypothetical protein V1697_00680 [Candidatus Levyibacteriota bacterium]
MENTDEQSRPPLAVEAERFIVGGLNFIKKGEFQKANLYFRDPKKAKKLGIEFDQDSHKYVISGFMTKEKEAEALDFCAQYSFFYHGDTMNGETPSVTIANIYTKDLNGRLPKSLMHEMALISAEEWIHALQHMRGIPLSGESNREIDVLAYFAQQGIPLTKAFMARHRRKDSLIKTK